MAIHAIVSLPRASSKVPVSGHATMASIFKVAVLWTVALGAELNDVREGDGGAIGQAECFVVVWVVATDTFEGVVFERHVLVEVFQGAGIFREHVGLLSVVAIVATYHDWIAFAVFFAGVYHRHKVRFSDGHRVLFFSWGPRFKLLSIRIG